MDRTFAFYKVDAHGVQDAADPLGSAAATVVPAGVVTGLPRRDGRAVAVRLGEPGRKRSGRAAGVRGGGDAGGGDDEGGEDGGEAHVELEGKLR